MNHADPKLRVTIQSVARALSVAQRVLFITGAGISADSGLPTYRGSGGLYNDRHTEEGYAIETVLSGEMLRTKPELTWKYLAQIETGCRAAKPNRAHQVIAGLESRIAEVLVYTQNIDGLHCVAGSSQVIEIHGNLYRMSCTVCDHRFLVSDYTRLDMPPECPKCRAMVRPDVVLFGESLPHRELDRLYIALNKGFDLVFSIGTSSVFPYITEPVIWARHSGIPVVEINPGQTPLSSIVDYRIPLGAAAAMAAIDDALSVC